MVNYICPMFRFATQTFNGAIWWGTSGALFTLENVVVSHWKILPKCRKEIICPEQFNPARKFAERLKWKLLETRITFCSVRTSPAPIKKFWTGTSWICKSRKIAWMAMVALSSGREPMLYTIYFYLCPTNSPIFSQMFKLSFPIKWSLVIYLQWWREITTITTRSPSLKNGSNKYQSTVFICDDCKHNIPGLIDVLITILKSTLPYCAS